MSLKDRESKTYRNPTISLLISLQIFLQAGSILSPARTDAHDTGILIAEKQPAYTKTARQEEQPWRILYIMARALAPVIAGFFAIAQLFVLVRIIVWARAMRREKLSIGAGTYESGAETKSEKNQSQNE